MTQFLPPNLLALFAARDPIPYLPPAEKLPYEKEIAPYHGIAAFVNNFEDPKDAPPPTRVETKDERKERRRREKAEQVAYKLEQELALWDPSSNSIIQGDPYKTLFITRINYDTSESKLRREFEVYGPIRRIRLVTNMRSGKPRGYAFVEYEHERDMHSAYKHADGKKIDGRRVLVDVERGRTVKGWRPRRLGGGLGGTRKGGPDENVKYSGRDEASGRDNRSRSRSRGRARRSRSRERPERERERERPRRSRSRDRKPRDDDEKPAKRRRSRSPAKEKERRRSRSRDRKRSRRSRSRDRSKAERNQIEEPPAPPPPAEDYDGMPPESGYPEYDEYNMNNGSNFVDPYGAQ